MLLIFLFFYVPRLKTSGLFCPSYNKVANLLKMCFPLMLNGMINAWLIYLPRHAVQTILGNEVLGYYGSISIIIVFLSTISVPIYAVILPELSKYVSKRDPKIIRGYLFKVFQILALIGIITFAIGRLIGPLALTIVYGDSLHNHMEILTPVLINAILLLFVGFFDSYFIPLNRRKSLLFANIMALVICIIFVNRITERYGAIGAAYTMAGSLAVRLVILCLCNEIALRKFDAANLI